MIRLLTLLILIITTATGWAQDLSQSRGYQEVVLHGDLVYHYPHRVLYFFPSREGLLITHENGYLTIQNPRGNTNINVEVIKEDGTPDYIKVILISRLNQKIRKENSVQRQVTSEKSVILRYSKLYTTRQLEKNGENQGDLLFNSNRIFFQNIINSNNKFTFNFWDQKSQYFSKKSQYRSFYNLRYDYKNVFYENGFGSSNVRGGMLNTSGYVWLNRLAYRDRNWLFAATEGKARDLIEDPDQIYGFNFAYDNLTNFTVGSYVFSNPTKEIINPTIDSSLRIGRLHVKSEFTFNQDGINDRNSFNYAYSLNYAPNLDYFRSVSFAQRVIQNGQFDPIYGNISNFSADTRNASAVFGLMKRNQDKDYTKDLRQDLTLTLNYSNFTTDSAYSQAGGASLGWIIERVRLGMTYSYSQAESLHSNNSSSHAQVFNPSISFPLTGTSNSRQRHLTISDYIAKNSNGLDVNNLRLTYTDRGAVDRIQLSFAKRSQTDNRIDSANNFYSLGAGYGRTVNSKFNYNLNASMILSQIEQAQISAASTSLEDDGTNLTNYSYSANVNYRPWVNHNFRLGLGQTVSNRGSFDSRITSGSFNYTYTFQGDWKTPLNYIVNNRSLKLHFFEDTNYNNKFDKGEKLVSNASIQIRGANGYSERKTTDGDGYVRFSGLAKQSYNVIIESATLSPILNENRILDLSDNSITKEVGLGKVRNVVFKTYDTTLKDVVSGVFFYDVSCPSINYTTKIASSGQTSVNASIPDVDDCVASVDVTQHRQYVEEADLAEVKLEKNDIVFTITQLDKIDIAVYVDYNKNQVIDDGEALRNKEIYAEFQGRKHFVNAEGIISIIYDQSQPKGGVFLDSLLKVPSNMHCVQPHTLLSFKQGFFQRFSAEIFCTLKK